MLQVDANKLYSKAGLPAKALEVRQRALNDLATFIRLVCPWQMMGHCHEDLCEWLSEDTGQQKLLLWPRDHGKSRMAALYVAWLITRQPDVAVIYASATAGLGEKMLRFIKEQIFESPKFKTYFGDLICEDAQKRTKWSNNEIIVDHPMRKIKGSSDSTILVVGVGANITGRHCDYLVLDDLVTYDNTVEEGDNGREKVNSWVALAASILSADSRILTVGTRYHPKDAYSIMINTEHEIYDLETGELVGVEPSFTVLESEVEHDGQFLWPRKKYEDGRAYGFDKNILAKKRAQYAENGQLTQFYAQYYNDPSDKSTSPITRDMFLYYPLDALTCRGGGWNHKNTPLTMYMAVDLAASASKKSDYTAIVIGGITVDADVYIIHAEQFKTINHSEIFNRILALYEKYYPKGIRIESVGAFKMISQDLKERLEVSGVRASIELWNPQNHIAKAQRINNILEPLYTTGKIYHYRGGDVEILEDQLTSGRPQHDDLKDAWAMCADPLFMVKPKVNKPRKFNNVVSYHPRWGGVI